MLAEKAWRVYETLLIQMRQCMFIYFYCLLRHIPRTVNPAVSFNVKMFKRLRNPVAFS